MPLRCGDMHGRSDPTTEKTAMTTDNAAPAGEIKWDTSPNDAALIERILDRAEANGLLEHIHRTNMEMDIKACHLNGTPLRLEDWLTADNFNFTHDLYGINAHMDRGTGRLRDHFIPRFHD